MIQKRASAPAELTVREHLAHLYRRAGFCATLAELDEAVALGYEATAEALLNPDRSPPLDEDVALRYHL